LRRDEPVDKVAVIPLNHQVFLGRRTLAGLRVEDVKPEESLIVSGNLCNQAEEEIAGQIDIDEMMKRRIDHHAPLAGPVAVPGADYAEGVTYRKFG